MIHVAMRYFILQALEFILEQEEFKDHRDNIELIISSIRICDASSPKEFLVLLIHELRSFDWT